LLDALDRTRARPPKIGDETLDNDVLEVLIDRLLVILDIMLRISKRLDSIVEMLAG
jgi:hypothetical protein